MAQNDENTLPPIDEPVDPTLLGDADLTPDFTDQVLQTDPVAAPGPSSSGAEDPASDDAETYFPPTDPVVTTNRHGDTRVLNGFAPTSDDTVEVERSASDGRLGDESIADAVRRELAEDALTTDLQVVVSVLNGVVHLRGVVQDLDEAERVEEIAGRVPGVRDVVEDLEVASV